MSVIVFLLKTENYIRYLEKCCQPRTFLVGEKAMEVIDEEEIIIIKLLQSAVKVVIVIIL